MGELYYGAGRARIRLDDHTLQHVSAVVTAKLRRNEPFLLSWPDDGAGGDEGRSAVWIHANCDLHYRYDSAEPVDLDRNLLEQMSRESSSAHGLTLQEATIERWTGPTGV